MIEKPSINSFNLLVLNASYSLRLLSRSSVILSSSFTRCKYCSSYKTVTASLVKIVTLNSQESNIAITVKIDNFLILISYFS